MKTQPHSPEIEQKIRERAYERYEFRKQFDVVFICDNRGEPRYITAEDDWLAAEWEIIDGQN